MKLAATLFLATSANAFTSPRPAFSKTTALRMIESDFASAMPSEPSVFDRCGFKEDELAIGVDAQDVLQWLGTKEDIVNKVMSDNKGWEKERATEEVEKFMMDADMVNAMIQYQRSKKDPATIRAEAEANLSDPLTWATYAAWIIGGAGFAYFKNRVAEPKYASGEWEPIRIDLTHMFGGGEAEQAATAAADTISNVVN